LCGQAADPAELETCALYTNVAHLLARQQYSLHSFQSELGNVRIGRVSRWFL
jgi:hypothetical protein